ncbi:MAG TPA: transcriptional regulator, partial [Weissella thailandensis]|uniref:transcriptional regulator n=1 Tax=Weissella thailandensis TaxID=89061 RepID=UPI001DAF92E6
DDLDYSDEDTDYDDEDVDSESEPFNAADYQTGVTYDQLARTPDDYKNKKVALSGEVIQVIEDDGVTEMRLAVNGDYDNVVLADITDSKRGDSHILENDNVTIYGYSAGTTSYESTMGSDITVPYVLLEKVQY